MPPFDRRTLLAGLAASLTGGGPALAQWTRPRTEDDPFYDTRRPYGTEDDLWARAPSGRRRRRDLDAVAGEDPYGAPSDTYGAPARSPFGGDPYAPRPGAGPGGPAARPTAAFGATGVDYPQAYAAQAGEPFPVPPVRWTSFNPVFLRQPVAYTGSEPPGTIIVDPRAHLLTLVEPGGRGMRYGVGVGKQGFSWSGVSTINSKQEWPDWYPPKEMIQRQPALARQVSQLQSGVGVPGGPHNPLGARALYLWQNNRDTLYRIHGTTEPFSIGKSVSSGCIRMINQDAMDLYARVTVGARVVVLG